MARSISARSEQWRLRVAHRTQSFAYVGFQLLLLVRESLRPLRLSRSRGSAVGLGTSGLDLSVQDSVGAGHTVHEIMRVGQRSLRHATERLAVVGLGILLVGRDVEGDEKHQVRSENTHTGKSGELLASTFAVVGHPGKVSRGEVGVRCEIDKSCDWLASNFDKRRPIEQTDRDQ